MNRRRIKKFVLDTLGLQELDEINSIFETIAPARLLNPLFSSLCHVNETVRWHGISVLGEVIGEIADQNLEDARVVMRRLMWMLNDESGGIGWGVPESMAEAMVNNQSLAEEYLHMLVSYTLDDGPELCQHGNFLELPFLQRGVLWGLCRVSMEYSNLLLQHEMGKNLAPYFSSADEHVVGLACCLGEILELKMDSVETKKIFSSRMLRIYLEGVFHEVPLKQIVEGALQPSHRSRNPFLQPNNGKTD